ncbi:MAG TPA: acyl-CoA dehydrogenase family protein [Methylomirabilota bacterium]|nr:acyl-CoA dehydrogenase family protein [Methylomirabilota bacterium]
MDRGRAGLDDETLDMVLGTLRSVAERRLDKATRLRLDHDDEFPVELIREMLGPELGLHLLFLPEEVGGLGGGGRDLFRVSEEMARIDLGVATAFLAIALGVDPIIVGGTEEQRARWLGRIADEGLIVAYGVTEPEAGSNVARLKTEAVPVTDGDGRVTAYRITGSKQFITNGGVAQIYTILARAPGGPSFFVVERGAPGFEVGEPEHKHGIRASNTTSLVLDNVEVPADHLLGLEEGLGLEHANRVFGFTRLMVASFGLGAGEEAVRRAIAYGRERVQFGEPLMAKQGFTHKLIVPHVVRLEAARAYCEWVAGRLDEGEPGLQVEGAVAKYFASEAGNAAADAAIQAHGGYGYTHEYEVEKIRRDVRITTIYEGTSEILQSIIGTHRWRMTVKTGGGFYRGMATGLRELGTGEAAALAADALAETILACHRRKLPREQWVMFELARLAAEVETALALARKAAEDPGANRDLLLPCARLHGGAAARAVAATGLELLRASSRYDEAEIAAWREAVRIDELLGTADGELELRSRVVAGLDGMWPA